jgi:hypothetical protein
MRIDAQSTLLVADSLTTVCGRQRALRAYPRSTSADCEPPLSDDLERGRQRKTR